MAFKVDVLDSKSAQHPKAMRLASKETKIGEDMIRSYVRKRYGIVGDDWEAKEVQQKHSKELRNKGEEVNHATD